MVQPQMQQCVSQGFQLANQIRVIANGVDDLAGRYALTEAARHVEEGIRECNTARMMLGGQNYTPYF